MTSYNEMVAISPSERGKGRAWDHVIIKPVASAMGREDPALEPEEEPWQPHLGFRLCL